MDYKGLGLDAPTSAKYNGCIACQYAEGYTFALLAASVMHQDGGMSLSNCYMWIY